jgi:O-antigen ligase/polysaccharide polymerase Wzy-like membrane protein
VQEEAGCEAQEVQEEGHEASGLGLGLAALVAAAAIVPVLAGGGFDPLPRAAFAILAGAALAAALRSGEGILVDRARAVAVVALFGLAGLSVVSAVWTIGDRTEALRTGLVVAAYGALALAAAVASRRRHGVLIIVALIACLAGVTAVLGLVGVALRSEPLAERIGGTWRPGGTFEYPSGLALIQVMAMPALFTAMVRGRTAFALPAAAGAVLAGQVLVLALNRTEIALAALVLLAGVLVPARTLRCPRSLALAATGLVVASAAAAHLLAGGFVPARHHDPNFGVLVSIVATTVVAVGAWWLVRSRPWVVFRRRLRLADRSSGRFVAFATVAFACLTVVLAVTLINREPRGPSIERQQGIAHGRVGLWRASLETAAERPLQGAGAGAFLAASADRQPRPPVLYAHDLPLESAVELGIPGFLLILGLYVGSVIAVHGARHSERFWLLGPAVAAFLAANLVDWPWHLAGLGAVWALALGGLIGGVACRPARTASSAAWSARSVATFTAPNPIRGC